MSPPDVIGFASTALPGRVAIRAGERAWTYRELAARARRLARRLRDRGLAPGDRVAILSHNDIAHFDLLIAAPIAGVIAVPLNTRLSLAELSVLIANVQPALLLVDPAHEAVGLALGLATIRLSDYEAWLADAPTDRLPPITPARTADDTHLILLTGGSTGTPKGACLPYRQTLGNADDSAKVWSLRPDDVAIQSTPCFHAAANVLSLPLLRVGGTVLLMSHFDPAEYLRLAVAHRASMLFMVPTMFAALADTPGFASADLSAVRMALSGGAPCPPSLPRRPIRQRRLWLWRVHGRVRERYPCPRSRRTGSKRARPRRRRQAGSRCHRSWDPTRRPARSCARHHRCRTALCHRRHQRSGDDGPRSRTAPS